MRERVKMFIVTFLFSECESMMYAFVTFISINDAAKAKDELNSMVFIGGSVCKVLS